jgi:zinc protease
MCVKKEWLGLALWLCALWVTGAQGGPVIEQWNTQGGSRVLFVKAEGLPLLDVRVVFAAGSARDGEQHGVAALTSALLDTGAGSWDADAIAQRLEGVGAVLGSGASRDSAWLSLRTLTEADKLRVALETAQAVLVQPRFSPRDFQREKQRTLLALKQKEELPADIAEITYYEALYGAHPYAHLPNGRIKTVAGLKREDLIRFYRRYYVARNAMLVLVGDVSREQAEEIAASLLRGLPEGAAAEPLPAAAENGNGAVLRKTFPSAQTHVLAGAPVLSFNDPDYFPLYVGNHILGGSGLVSRIIAEVREKRGLSYSAYSYFQPQAARGPFTMGLQTRNNQVDEAVRVLNDTLREFIANGPTDEELTAAKKNITGGFVLRIDSNQKIAETVAMIGLYGLPLDYLDTFSAKIEAVSRDDIRRAFRERLTPEHFKTVIVGGSAKAD